MHIFLLSPFFTSIHGYANSALKYRTHQTKTHIKHLHLWMVFSLLFPLTNGILHWESWFLLNRNLCNRLCCIKLCVCVCVVGEKKEIDSVERERERTENKNETEFNVSLVVPLGKHPETSIYVCSLGMCINYVHTQCFLVYFSNKRIALFNCNQPHSMCATLCLNLLPTQRNKKTDDRIFAHFSPSNFMLQNCCAAAFVLVSIRNSTRMKLHAFILVLDVF